MRPSKNVSDFIKNASIHTKDATDDRVLRNMHQAYADAEGRAGSRKVVLRGRMVRWAIPAAAIFMIALLFLLGDGQQKLCAQALQAIAQARTLHLTAREYHNGQYFKDHEIWYDRMAGMMEQERYADRTDVRIDSRQYEWRYSEGYDYVGRQKSYRNNDELVMNLCATWLNLEPRRVPSGDTHVLGVPCRMYAITESSGSCSIWVDEKNYVRRAELSQKGQVGEEGEIRTLMEIEYDTTIDQRLFEPQFDPNVKVVDPRGFIEQQYPLDKALFTRESVGFTFAVHRLERCPDGSKYLVCSNRLTDETRQEVEATHPWTFYGSACLSEVSAGLYFDRVEPLAGMSNDGIRVDWYLLLPGGDKTAEVAGCDVNIEILTANRLEERRKAGGAPTREQFRLFIPKEKVRQTPKSLRDLLGDLYSLGEQLDPIVHSFLLVEIIKSPGAHAQVGRRPGIQLSKEQYVRNVEQRVKNWSQRDQGHLSHDLEMRQ